MTVDAVVVIAKEPLPGKVKTRLVTPGLIDAAQSAELAAAALRDTLEALAEYPCRRRVLLLDGARPDWVDDRWQVIAQACGTLDARLAHGIGAAGPGSVLLVGMDTPQLSGVVLGGWSPADSDACLGLSTDGGYWAIGLADSAMAAQVIDGVPMSQDDTGAVQLDRLRQAGLTVTLLATMTDVDTVQSATQVADEYPRTRFARQWREFTMTGQDDERTDRAS